MIETWDIYHVTTCNRTVSCLAGLCLAKKTNLKSGPHVCLQIEAVIIMVGAETSQDLFVNLQALSKYNRLEYQWKYINSCFPLTETSKYSSRVVFNIKFPLQIEQLLASQLNMMCFVSGLCYSVYWFIDADFRWVGATHTSLDHLYQLERIKINLQETGAI